VLITVEQANIGPLLLRLVCWQRRDVYFVTSQHDAAPSLVVISVPTVSRNRGEKQFQRAVDAMRAKYEEKAA
jgi:hypothetical protein